MLLLLIWCRAVIANVQRRMTVITLTRILLLSIIGKTNKLEADIIKIILTGLSNGNTHSSIYSNRMVPLIPEKSASTFENFWMQKNRESIFSLYGTV
jgi:hypothetical protein